MKVHRTLSRRGFTLIELLVAITISVVLLSILAQVFKLATQATRDANMRISLTERLRALNIRMRTEFSNMIGQSRPKAKLQQCYDLDTNGQYISFATSTDEDGRPVNVDVKYVFMSGASGKEEEGKLIRRRDLTGPYVLDSDGQVVVDKVTGKPKDNPNALIGDDQFFEDSKKGDQSSDATVMMTNVRSVRFRVIDPPPDPAAAATLGLLNPRTLPAAVEMEIQYGPDVGNVDNLDWIKIVFPVYKGL